MAGLDAVARPPLRPGGPGSGERHGVFRQLLPSPAGRAGVPGAGLVEAGLPGGGLPYPATRPAETPARPGPSTDPGAERSVTTVPPGGDRPGVAAAPGIVPSPVPAEPTAERSTPSSLPGSVAAQRPGRRPGPPATPALTSARSEAPQPSQPRPPAIEPVPRSADVPVPAALPEPSTPARTPRSGRPKLSASESGQDPIRVNARYLRAPSAPPPMASARSQPAAAPAALPALPAPAAVRPVPADGGRPEPATAERRTEPPAARPPRPAPAATTGDAGRPAAIRSPARPVPASVPTPRTIPSPAVPAPAPSATQTGPRVSIQVGEVLIRTTPSRPAAQTVRRGTPARAHSIDPRLRLHTGG